MTISPVLGAATISAAAVGAWWSLTGDRRLARTVTRNLHAGLSEVPAAAGSGAPRTVSPRVPLSKRVATEARRLTPNAMTEGLNRRILMAGMSSRWPLERTLAAKILLGILGLLLGFLLITTGNPIGIIYGPAAPLVCFFGPDLVLRMKAKKRQHEIRLALPDTLDQITVCVEAGLGFEGAMARTAKTGEGPLADEILRTLQDIQLGVPRKDAMRRLADRSEVEELRHFVLAIIQAEGYGVPIARVLRIQSSELREKRRQSAEEQAMKIGIKMLFPLVFCILPTVFIVILVPAIFRLMSSLGGTKL